MTDTAVDAIGSPPERLWRVEAVAERFDVSRTTVFALIRSGELKSLRIGGSRRVPESAIAEYLAEQLAATQSHKAAG